MIAFLFVFQQDGSWRSCPALERPPERGDAQIPLPASQVQPTIPIHGKLDLSENPRWAKKGVTEEGSWRFCLEMQKEIFVQVKTLLQIYLCHRSIKLFRRCYNITFANLPVKGTWLHFWNQSHVRFMLNFGVLVSDLECFWEWAGPVLHNYPYQALCNMGLLAIPLMLQSQSYLKSPLTILEVRSSTNCHHLHCKLQLFYLRE